MKLAAAALFLALALAVGYVAWVTPVSFETTNGASPAGPGPTPASGVEGGAELVELREQLARLDQRVAALSGELELLRTQVQRRPAEAPDVAASEALLSAARLDPGGGGLDDAQRQAIEDILARAREQEAALRAEERAAREEQLVLDRAARVAERLALAPADRRLLEEHLRDESARRRAIIERSRQADYDRELLRDEFVALGDWSEQHLMDTFGADLAAQIRAAERETRGASLDRGAGLERAERGRRDPGTGRRER